MPPRRMISFRLPHKLESNELSYLKHGTYDGGYYLMTELGSQFLEHLRELDNEASFKGQHPRALGTPN